MQAFMLPPTNRLSVRSFARPPASHSTSTAQRNSRSRRASGSGSGSGSAAQALLRLVASPPPPPATPSHLLPTGASPASSSPALRPRPVLVLDFVAFILTAHPSPSASPSPLPGFRSTFLPSHPIPSHGLLPPCFPCAHLSESAGLRGIRVLDLDRLRPGFQQLGEIPPKDQFRWSKRTA